jgi:hypothetical protein
MAMRHRGTWLRGTWGRSTRFRDARLTAHDEMAHVVIRRVRGEDSERHMTEDTC